MISRFGSLAARVAACVPILSMWWATTSRRCLRTPRAAAKSSSRSCGAMRTPLSFATCAFSPRRTPRTSPPRPGSTWSAGLPRFTGDEAAWRAWLFTTARRRLLDQARHAQAAPGGAAGRDQRWPRCRRSPDAAQLALDNLATESAIALVAQLPDAAGRRDHAAGRRRARHRGGRRACSARRRQRPGDGAPRPARGWRRCSAGPGRHLAGGCNALSGIWRSGR